jgi:hypothetical protein
MRAWGMLALVWLAGCEARPDRVDPLDFPAARTDTGLAPTANNCRTRTAPFTASLNRFLVEDFEGYGEFDYQSVPRRTGIVLYPCNRGRRDVSITLAYFGGDRVVPGSYPASRTAETDSGFRLIYVDPSEERAVVCDDKQQGTVVIDEVSAGRMRGSFDVVVRCIGSDNLSPYPQPGNTRFTGSFEAVDVGIE